MKKVVFFALMILSSALAFAQSDGLTTQQRAFMNQMMQFLREEGFSPSIDSDNDLCFKKEGVKYWISIEDNGPFYIEVHRGAFSCEGVDRDKMLQAFNYANSTTKVAKFSLLKRTSTLAVEMYCHSAEEFKYVIYKCISSLDIAYKKAKAYYNDEL